ncbi:MAG: CYTH domain-containing protein [Dehalococcoidia bacterium]|nr:CYTH domain-containing protein [Dehalococcoidia bacterium]
MRNIEVKARVEDPARLVGRVLELGATLAWERHQRDTFFAVPDGYLKLREMEGGAELIAYRREPASEPRPSDYEVAKVDEPLQVAALLRGRFGVRGVVEKQRRCFQWRHTRIHLDEVEGLGPFVELETVVSGGLSNEAAEAEAREVMERLEIDPAAAVPGAYLELIEGRAR